MSCPLTAFLIGRIAGFKPETRPTILSSTRFQPLCLQAHALSFTSLSPEDGSCATPSSGSRLPFS